jgi:hypothetical protein
VADGFGDAQEDLKGRDAREKIESNLIGSFLPLREKGKDVIHSLLMVSNDLPDQTFGIVNLFSVARKEEVDIQLLNLFQGRQILLEARVTEGSFVIRNI